MLAHFPHSQLHLKHNYHHNHYFHIQYPCPHHFAQLNTCKALIVTHSFLNPLLVNNISLQWIISIKNFLWSYVIIHVVASVCYFTFQFQWNTFRL